MKVIEATNNAIFRRKKAPAKILPFFGGMAVSDPRPGIRAMSGLTTNLQRIFIKNNIKCEVHSAYWQPFFSFKTRSLPSQPLFS